MRMPIIESNRDLFAGRAQVKSTIGSLLRDVHFHMSGIALLISDVYSQRLPVRECQEQRSTKSF